MASRIIGSLAVLLVASVGVAACGDDETGSGGSGASSSSQGGSTTTASGGNGASGGTGGSSATGGSASGGSATGGSASGGSGSMAVAECVQDTDCRLVDDCCTCEALPNGATDPVCNDVNCLVPTCQASGHDKTITPLCIAGRCVKDVTCDLTIVTCKIPVPSCPAGMVPSADPTTSCYGPCVAPGECSAVTDCTTCTAAGLACVTYQTQLGNQVHCTDVPAPCTNNSCACLGPSVCTGAFDTCNDSADGPQCSCPNC